MNNAYAAYRFEVLVDDVIVARFTDVSGLDIPQESIEYRESGGAQRAVKLPGLAKYSNVTLKMGVCTLRIINWCADGIGGRIDRKDVRIRLVDENQHPVCAWTLTRAWPVKFEMSELPFWTEETAIEVLVFSHEGLTRESV